MCTYTCTLAVGAGIQSGRADTPLLFHLHKRLLRLFPLLSVEYRSAKEWRHDSSSRCTALEQPWALREWHLRLTSDRSICIGLQCRQRRCGLAGTLFQASDPAKRQLRLRRYSLPSSLLSCLHLTPPSCSSEQRRVSPTASHFYYVSPWAARAWTYLIFCLRFNWTRE